MKAENGKLKAEMRVSALRASRLKISAFSFQLSAFLLCFPLSAFAATESVVVDSSTRAVKNTGAINYATGQLKVNGTAVVAGGGGAGDVSSDETSVTDGDPIVFSGTDGKTIRAAEANEILQYDDPGYDFLLGYDSGTGTLRYRYSNDGTMANNDPLRIPSEAAVRSYVLAHEFGGGWTDLDFTSSDLADLEARNFADLQNIPEVGKCLFVDAAEGNNGTALPHRPDLPYATLAAAKAAASSGETVVVWAGTYTPTTSILKNGVNWHFHAGAVVAQSGDIEFGALDDAGVAITSVISGSGDFSLNQTGGTYNYVAAVKTSHADSNLSVSANSISASESGSNGDSGAVIGVDGSLRVTAGTITASDFTYSVYWENGDTHVRAETITGDDVSAVSSFCGGTPTGKFWVQANEIISLGTSSPAINFSDPEANAQVWVDALEIRGVAGGVQHQGAGKGYVTAQKIGATANSGVAVAAQGSGFLWVSAQKLTGANIITIQGTATAHLDTLQIEESGTTGNGITMSGGTLHLWRGRLAMSHGDGLNLSAGTAYLYDVTLDTSASASKNPIVKSGGTLTLGAGTLLIAEGTRDSISAASAQGVISYGATANRAVDADVTITGGLSIAGAIPTQWLGATSTTAAAGNHTHAIGTVTGLGTGIATALGVNIGSAGAPVLFNGAGGTPSSLTLTNATGLPVSGITASTSTALGVGSLELGHATDTTLSRLAAGSLGVEGVAVPTVSSTSTLTNKRITKRVVSVSDATSITPDSDASDLVTQANTQAAGTLTINAPTGTPTDGQGIALRIKCTNAQTLSWNAIYRAGADLSLPTATTGSSKTGYYTFYYNATDTKWDLAGASLGY